MALDQFLAAVRDHVEQRERQEGVVFSCDRRQYAAAVFIIRMFLGDRWCEKTLFSPIPDRYLVNQSGDFGRFKFQDRIVALGELLLNLRYIDGVDQRIEALKTESLETAVAELEGARLLMSSAIPFRFIKPAGSLGQDYDVQAMIDGSPVACEMKAKLEQTEPSQTSVRNTLDRARGQLPLDQAGVVFLKLPETWATSEAGRTAVEEGMRVAFDRTHRIAAVIAHWEQWQALNSSAARIVMFKHFSNSRARLGLESLARAVKAWPETIGGDWIALERLVCEEPDVAKAIAAGMALSAVAFARGAAPLSGFGAAYYGSLEPLTASPRTIFRIVFDFRSNEFDLFGTHSGRSANVTLAAGPARVFTVLRGEQLDAFQLQISDHPLNAALPEVVAAVASQIETIQNRAGAPQEPTEAANAFVNDDPLIRFVRSIFDQLRAEGDLQPNRCVLRDLIASFLVSSSDEVAFQVRYFGIAFTI